MLDMDADMVKVRNVAQISLVIIIIALNCHCMRSYCMPTDHYMRSADVSKDLEAGHGSPRPYAHSGQQALGMRVLMPNLFAMATLKAS